MGKALPILGIVACVFAALGAIMLVAPATFLVPLVAVVVGVFLILERQPLGLISGVVAILFGLISLFGLVGNVSIKGGADAGAPMSPELGLALAIGSCLVAAGGVLLARAEDVEPSWMGYGGLACVLVAFVLALVLQNRLTPPYTAEYLPTFVLALLALITIVPLVVALRGANARVD